MRSFIAMFWVRKSIIKNCKWGQGKKRFQERFIKCLFWNVLLTNNSTDSKNLWITEISINLAGAQKIETYFGVIGSLTNFIFNAQKEKTKWMNQNRINFFKKLIEESKNKKIETRLRVVTTDEGINLSVVQRVSNRKSKTKEM